MNDWLDKYKTNMDSRYPTFKVAFDLLWQLPSHNIMETGCMRLENDWGAGCSTLLFGEFCRNFGGKLTSVDIFKKHLDISKAITKDYNDLIEYVESDSISFLASYSGVIDFLYLDSMDVPLGPGDSRLPCQQHSLKEFMAAEAKLHDKSIVLLDDYFDGGGKGRLTEKYMMDLGWRRVMAFQQQLFVK